MKTKLLLLAPLLVIPVLLVAQAPNKQRVLRSEAVVAAPVADVWSAWTTKEGLQAWLAPLAEVELRLGGTWRTNYNPKGKIGDEGTITHHIMAYEPERMMSSRFTAPANAKIAKVAEGTWTVIRLEPIAEKQTRVSVAMVGWGEGPDWDAAYDFFKRGNEWTLQQLAKHFAAKSAAAGSDLTVGRDRGKSKIELEKMVACPADKAYAMWSTAEGLKFFAANSRVDSRPGGEFTIIFDPKGDPEALSHGSGGARVLKATPAREFAFEWPAFVSRDDLPGGPPRWPEQRNARPLATWVELAFEPAAHQTNQTRVHLEMVGFQDGEKWEQARAYFTNAWGMVLGGMERACAQQMAGK